MEGIKSKPFEKRWVFFKSYTEARNDSEEAKYVSVNSNYRCGRLNKMEIPGKLIYEITYYIDVRD